ncbi:uncharacterized protein G2W53_021213 [Senna tora]|uniref:Uncharacterized protein n=1 Tax=Senna tora TaxID=362788 RepID=A0A834WN84_9FABA|nr:uncharacterized protein G2W53_021213 [Senna tora]
MGVPADGKNMNVINRRFLGEKEESAGRKRRCITQAPKKQYTQTLSRGLFVLLQVISIVSEIIEAEIVEMERALETFEKKEATAS